jgi:GT2 family glycosyltransferase
MTYSAQLQTVDVLIRSTGRPELQQALASLTAQTYPALRIYIADAAAIGLQASSASSHPIEIVTTGQKMPRSQAANELLDRAQSPLALFLDEDDWLLPEHIEKLVLGLAQSPQSVMAYTDTRCVRIHDQGQETVVREYVQPYQAEQLMLENYIPIHAAVFRRTPTTQACRFDPSLDLFEDWDFWLQLQQAGPFVHQPGISAVYRIHAQSGAGVEFDNADLAVQTLQQLLQKWQQRWTPQQLQKLWGYSRQVPNLQKAHDSLEVDLQERTLAYQTSVTQLEAQLLQTRQEHAQALAQQQAQFEAQQQAQQQALVELYENTRSWRITAPLRDAGQWARSLRQTVLHTWPRRISAQALTWLTALYKNDAIYHVAKLVPSGVKRHIRNRLMYLAHEPRQTHAVYGLTLQKHFERLPKVSIIIPVYNHLPYLRQCIDSALAQTYPHTEVVIIDDHSPDPQVLPLLQSYADHPRVQLLQNPHNLGIAEAQNRALMASTGDLLAFLDCDDLLAPEAIATCVQQWKSDTIYLHTGRINIDKDGAEINRIQFMGLPRTDYFAENLRAMYATHLKIIRRDAFAKVGLFDPRFDSAQDYEMLMRIAFHYPSSSFVHVPDCLYSHRLHAQQTTETQNSKQIALTTQIQHEAQLRDAIRRGDYKRPISIIMLSYGKHTQTLQALQGLQKTVHIPHEIILYDNGSTSETVDFLKNRIDGQFPNVQVIYGDTNLGPAQGRRQALEYASGEWFLIFDNDEIPEPGWLEELLLRAESNPQVGAVCCRVTFPNGKLQFSGGKVEQANPLDPVIDLGLHDFGKAHDDLSTCGFREVDWCPIGATLFTVNIAPYLHDGYPNTFEDAGVSYALKKAGYRLLNAPGALVWHEHITFQPKVDMGKKYMADRYNPKMMLKSVASFYAENGLIIKDEYIWRENGLNTMNRQQLLDALKQAGQTKTSFH